MEANHTITYRVDKSAERIDAILNASNDNFSDSKCIPSRNDLTYTNGYYVYITVLFIDLVGSSDMTDEHKRPTLAKIYRSFISECTAIINSSSLSKEININGDCVWGVFETPYKSDIDDVFSVACQLNSLMKILNYKLRKKNYNEIAAGIGLSYGRVLMAKAGYSGSGINDVVWMGDAVNEACHLANKANREGRDPIICSDVFYSNLNDDNKKFFSKNHIYSSFYEANAININMNDWYKENCK